MLEHNEFEQMGGRNSLVAISKIFYDKVYQHAWLKLFFEEIPQQHIESQQVDFMQKVLGGDNIYAGKSPPAAHQHIFINEEVFEVRQKLLIESFSEARASDALIEKWLNLENSFKRVLLKSSPKACKGRYKSDPVLAFPNPEQTP